MMTVEQAQAIALYAKRGIVAASYGIGSDGYPPANDYVWLMLTSDRTFWVKPDGTEEAA